MTSKDEIRARLAALRETMKTEGVDASIIPHSDPHQSEYPGEHWQARRYLSGFTGSAGSLVVTTDGALLWTDSRYFLQAAEQLEGTGIELMKASLPDTPTIAEYLCGHLKAGSTVGVDGMLFSYRDAESLRSSLASKGIRLNLAFDPIAKIWAGRPALPQGKVFIHPVERAGASAAEKLAAIRNFLSEKNADAILISALDETAWTLNLRCDDVKCSPVLTSYLYITRKGATLFVDPDKITPETAAYLDANEIKTAPYSSLTTFLTSVREPVVAADPATTSSRVMELLGPRAKTVTSPVPLMKAVKNATEIKGFREALLRDSVALVKAHMELEKRVKAGEPVDEMTVCSIWRRHRSEQEMFFDESFDTIAGYGAHGAIVHYSPTPESAAAIGTESLLLIDSGAQYLDGTTDITRTICLGTPTPEQRHHFTLVLKGNIGLACAIFPEGTRGAQLDILAHGPLWREGLTYLHGTGHGVGHFLNVHEGPHQIRMNEIPTPLRAGMIVTDEPGLYLEGQYGIRCENMLLTVPAFRTEMGSFLKFDVLTLFPFDRKLIETGALTENELEWLNSYHARVYDTLSRRLTRAERAWLAAATAPIYRDTDNNN